MSKRDRWVARAFAFVTVLGAALAFLVFLAKWKITFVLVLVISALLIPALLLAEWFVEKAFAEEAQEPGRNFGGRLR